MGDVGQGGVGKGWAGWGGVEEGGVECVEGAMGDRQGAACYQYLLFHVCAVAIFRAHTACHEAHCLTLCLRNDVGVTT